MPVLSMHITHNMGESSHAQCGLLWPKHEHQTITEIEETQQPLTTSQSRESNIDMHVRKAEQVILPPCYQAYISEQF